MRAMLIGSWLLLALSGCDRETGFYVDSGTDARICGDNMPSIFFEDDKVSGSAFLTLGGSSVPLIDVRTRDHLPHMITLSLGAMIAQPAVTAFVPVDDYEVVALLTVGVGGIPFTCEVDFLGNVQFSLAANQLRVEAIYRRNVWAGGTGVAPEPTYNAGASVASGVLAHGYAPQRTIGYRTLGAPFALGAGASRTHNIPLFSKAVVFLGDPSNAQLQISFLNNTGGVMVVFPVVGFPSAKVAVPNGATQFTVTNTDAVNPVTAYYGVFDLAI